ncbi:MAG: TonB-dependent receptor [Sediminibacterium sp.]|nr:TonB-dependent receptor [Sediminibacterium sp.]
MKTASILFVFLLPFVMAGAQENVGGNQLFTGSVIGKRDNRPLPLAAITVLKTGKTQLADSNGIFQLKDAAPGKHRIRISYSGYAGLVKDITVPGTGYFHLDEMETELEQVVVTAVAGATKVRRTPVSIAIVSQKEMNRNTSTNVIDALLKAVPGISAITTGPNISKPFIRGLGYNRVLTLYDGIRQEGQQWGDEHGIEIDQYGIARAEVVKGPASLMYGSDAIAGVVNLIPRLPNGPDGKMTGDALTEYQSNNGMMGATASLHYKNKGFAWTLRSSAKTAANYRNAIDGRVYNTGFKEVNLSAMAGWEAQRSKNYFQVNLYDNLQEIPDGSRDSLTRKFTRQQKEADMDDIRSRDLVPAGLLYTYRTAALHQHIQHYRAYHKGVYRIGSGELTTLTGLQQNIRKEYNHPTAPEQAGLYVVLNTLNYEAKFSFAEWHGLQFTAGANGMYQQNKNRNATDFPIPDYRLFDLGTYLLVKKEFNKIVITGGLRLDNRAVNWNDFYTRKDLVSGFNKQVHFPDTIKALLSFPAYSKRFTGVSGSLGLVYNFSGNITLKANMARGYRSPSIPEIGSDGLDPGARIYYIGNRNFSPEFNWQADLGLFLNYPDADLAIELFDNRISNYIFFQKLFDANGQPLEIVPGNFTYQYKQGSARIFGAEATWMFHPKAYRWLHVQQSLSAITGLNTNQESLKIFGEDARYLPLIPPFRTASRLRVTIPQKNIHLEDLFLQTELETYAAQDHFYAVDNTETQTQGYALLNMGAGISITNKKDKSFCVFSVNVNNLFDVAYQSHQNRLKYFEYYQHSPNGKYGIYNMGRNLAVKAVFTW